MIPSAPILLVIDPPTDLEGEADSVSIKDLTPVAVFPWSPPPPPPDPDAPPPPPPPPPPDTVPDVEVLNPPKPQVQKGKKKGKKDDGGGGGPPPPPGGGGGESQPGRKVDPQVSKVVHDAVIRLTKGVARGFVPESLQGQLREASSFTDQDISSAVDAADRDLGTGLSSEQKQQAREKVRDIVGEQKKESTGNDTLDKVRDQLDKEKKSREEDQAGNPGSGDTGAGEDDPDLDDVLEKVVNDTVAESDEEDEEDILDALPVVKQDTDDSVFDSLETVGASKNVATWKRLLRSVLLTAAGVKEITNPARPSKRNEGQLGGREDVEEISTVMVMLDASSSMDVPKFKAVIRELEAMSRIYPFSEMFASSKVHLIKWSSSTFRYATTTGFGDIEKTFLGMGKGTTSDPRQKWIKAIEKVAGPVDLHINMGDGEYNYGENVSNIVWNPNKDFPDKKLKGLWTKRRLHRKTMFVFPDRIQDTTGMLTDLMGGKSQLKRYSVVFKSGG